MKLVTKEIEKKLQAQYVHGSDMSKQKVIAKFFDPVGSWTWYAMNQDPADPSYLWGIVKGFDIEAGSFSLTELESIKRPFGLGIERDLSFEPRPALDVWRALMDGKHV
jgi:hypothetical protein